ncbi:hypothetical protein [Vibrio vulnificus]|uniref:hypothetical protein n=1 Tax=Vibrio vulnificus TaxID=672 RepID=UPI0028799ED1|nr:hypothetical protein [Vibrio vulnificus]EHZ2591101.1 hypothetical protein [Vibrio parahaemolyticus]MDS1869844.1 hypothetical protein [Vibrio vulnificus]
MKPIYLLVLLVSLPVLSNTIPPHPVANNVNNFSLIPTSNFESDTELQSHTGTLIVPKFFGNDDGNDNVPAGTTGTLLGSEMFSTNDWLNKDIGLNCLVWGLTDSSGRQICANNQINTDSIESTKTGVTIPTGKKKRAETPPPQIKRVSLKEEIEQCGEDFSLTSDPTSLSVLCQRLQAVLKVERNQLDFLDEVIRHNKEIIDHRANTYNLQYYQTFGIGALVLAIVIVGLTLSWMQFTKDAFIQSATKVAEGNVIPPTSTTTIKLGEHIEISSSVIGLIILFISLFFFDRYITHVYTIHDPLAQATVEK